MKPVLILAFFMAAVFLILAIDTELSIINVSAHNPLYLLVLVEIIRLSTRI
jgi:hypothetical protein